MVKWRDKQIHKYLKIKLKDRIIQSIWVILLLINLIPTKIMQSCYMGTSIKIYFTFLYEALSIFDIIFKVVIF